MRNRNLLAGTLLVLAALNAIAGPLQKQPGARSIPPEVQAGHAEGWSGSAAVSSAAKAFSSDSQAYELLRELTTKVGQRLTATPNGVAAEEFVFDKLKAYGFEDVVYQAFPVTSWQRGEVTLDVDGKSIPAAALVNSPASADVAAQLVDVDNGTPADYGSKPDRARGKIALVYLGILSGSPADTPRLHRNEKMKIAIAHGAAGVIFINRSPGAMLVTGSADYPDEAVKPPAITISHDSGLALKKSLEARPMRARIRMSNEVAPGTARNVIATLRGSTHAEEIIVLGGHLDCLDLATGAVDNGSGSMWVLDVARGFKLHGFRPKRTIKFVFFMGEELGLFGSYAFVKQAKEDGTLGRIKYMINTDMVINPKGFNVWGGDPDMEFFDELSSAVREYYPTFTAGPATGHARGVQSTDSQPFIEEGIPIVYPTPRWNDDMLSCVHTDCDTLKWVSVDDMRNSAGVGAMLVTALANAEKLPASTMSRAETDAYFKAERLEK